MFGVNFNGTLLANEVVMLYVSREFMALSLAYTCWPAGVKVGGEGVREGIEGQGVTNQGGPWLQAAAQGDITSGC